MSDASERDRAYAAATVSAILSGLDRTGHKFPFLASLDPATREEAYALDAEDRERRERGDLL